jgi:hypothetical protein
MKSVKNPDNLIKKTIPSVRRYDSSCKINKLIIVLHHFTVVRFSDYFLSFEC